MCVTECHLGGHIQHDPSRQSVLDWSLDCLSLVEEHMLGSLAMRRATQDRRSICGSVSGLVGRSNLPQNVPCADFEDADDAIDGLSLRLQIIDGQGYIYISSGDVPFLRLRFVRPGGV